MGIPRVENPYPACCGGCRQPKTRRVAPPNTSNRKDVRGHPSGLKCRTLAEAFYILRKAFALCRKHSTLWRKAFILWRRRSTSCGRCRQQKTRRVAPPNTSNRKDVRGHPSGLKCRTLAEDVRHFAEGIRTLAQAFYILRWAFALWQGYSTL